MDIDNPGNLRDKSRTYGKNAKETVGNIKFSTRDCERSSMQFTGWEFIHLASVSPTFYWIALISLDS